MELYPAIDLRNGRLVRLVEGDFAQETVYGDDPVEVARAFEAAGAAWVHVVDLDAALDGHPVNRSVVARIAAGTQLSVQAGGGVRSMEAAAALFDAGVARVVVGTAAVLQPGLLGQMARRWPGRVAAGVDHRGGEVRVRGWTEGGGRFVGELVPEVLAAGAAPVIVTDISRDGRMVGPDVEGLASLLHATGAPIIASGGVGGIDDVAALAALAPAGLVGVIAGRAIYEGRLDVARAVETCRAAGR